VSYVGGELERKCKQIYGAFGNEVGKESIRSGTLPNISSEKQKQ
jgi:hypothetical protein